MSRRSRKESRDEASESAFRRIERAGETSFPVSSPLPRAQERVQQAYEAASLLPTRRSDTPLPPPFRRLPESFLDDPGGMGGTPISAGRLGASYGPGRRLPPPYRRSSVRAGFPLLKQLRFFNPRRVLLCARRAIRREVLFAIGIGGKRKRSPGRGGSYRRTQDSQYSCR